MARQASDVALLADVTRVPDAAAETAATYADLKRRHATYRELAQTQVAYAALRSMHPGHDVIAIPRPSRVAHAPRGTTRAPRRRARSSTASRDGPRRSSDDDSDPPDVADPPPWREVAA
jgi:hypothetical protein